MSQLSQEFVVLVDENDNQIGIMSKRKVHNKNTPLHRAFSLYIFNQQGEFLLQQRKKEKITWGGFWSNSCCGHPVPGESRESAAKRRSKEELGIDMENIEKIADYRYKFEHKNIVENEICPILVGRVLISEVKPDPTEIESVKWVRWSWLLDDMKENEEKYSPWSKEQVSILAKSSHFVAWLKRYNLTLS